MVFPSFFTGFFPGIHPGRMAGPASSTPLVPQPLVLGLERVCQKRHGKVMKSRDFMGNLMKILGHPWFMAKKTAGNHGFAHHQLE
jgi:hypothetical protein